MRAGPLHLRTRSPAGFPSGQRGRTVNPLARPSQVRILPPPSATKTPQPGRSCLLLPRSELGATPHPQCGVSEGMPDEATGRKNGRRASPFRAPGARSGPAPRGVEAPASPTTVPRAASGCGDISARSRRLARTSSRPTTSSSTRTPPPPNGCPLEIGRRGPRRWPTPGVRSRRSQLPRSRAPRLGGRPTTRPTTSGSRGSRRRTPRQTPSDPASRARRGDATARPVGR